MSILAGPFELFVMQIRHLRQFFIFVQTKNQTGTSLRPIFNDLYTPQTWKESLSVLAPELNIQNPSMDVLNSIK